MTRRRTRVAAVVAALVLLGAAAAALGAVPALDRGDAQRASAPGVVAPLRAVPGAPRGPRTPRPRALPGDWARGVNLTAYARDAYGSARTAAALREVRHLGADSVAIWVPWYQRDRRATAIAPDRQLTPSDASLRRVVARARGLGLRVLLRPVVDVRDGTWRGALAPRSVATWFQGYGRFVERYARLAQELRVPALAVGCELATLTGAPHEGRWRTLVAAVRRRFAGTLTYSANWDEYRRIGWWDAVDVIGIDGYFPLSRGGTPSAGAIVGRWRRTVDEHGVAHDWQADVAAVQRRFHRPVVFTEVGWRSVPETLRVAAPRPLRYAADGQARAYDALFEAWRDVPWFRGIYLWQWSVTARGGAGDVDHTPQRKPAQAVIARWFRARARPTSPGTGG